MGREANFSELREAIRQGQAKIAQGLKSGQMRSDRPKDTEQTPRTRLDPAHEVLGKKLTLTEKSALFERHKKQKTRFKIPSFPKIRMPGLRWPQFSLVPLRPVLMGMGTILAVAAVVVVLFWIGKALIGLMPEGTTAPEQPVVQQPTVTPPASTGEVVKPQTQSAPSASSEPVRPTMVPSAARTGDNVIVIQNITTLRESELIPIRDFFAQHGIATEIIRAGNNYSRLVTRDRFDNPNRPGTDGYEMRMKIKDLGKRYPAETGDNKFGTEPFQDAYGLLRR